MHDDHLFWSNPEHTFGARYPQRAEAVGSFIGSINVRSVLDLGCGDQQLRRTVEAAGSKYIPCDLVKRSEDCIVCDINQYQYPALKVDLTVAVGLIQYIEDLGWLFEQIRSRSTRCIITLSPYTDLASVYSSIKPEHQYPIRSSLSYGMFIEKFFQYFVLCDELILPTGCRLFYGQARRRPSPWTRLLSSHEAENEGELIRTKEHWTKLKQDRHEQTLDLAVRQLSPDFIVKVCTRQHPAAQTHLADSQIGFRSIDIDDAPGQLEAELDAMTSALLLLPMKASALDWLQRQAEFIERHFNYIILQYPLIQELCSLRSSDQSPNSMTELKPHHLLSIKKLLFKHHYTVEFEMMTTLFAQVLICKRQTSVIDSGC